MMLNIFSYLLWKNVYSGFLPTFRSVIFLIILTLMSSLHILETNPFSDVFGITFSHSAGCLFICGWSPLLCKRKHPYIVCMYPVALMGVNTGCVSPGVCWQLPPWWEVGLELEVLDPQLGASLGFSCDPWPPLLYHRTRPSSLEQVP